MSAPRPDRSVLWRVYRHGLLMLMLSAGASLAVGHYVLEPAFNAPARPSTTWIARHMFTLIDQPARLAEDLSHLEHNSNIRLSVFDAQGKLVATNEKAPMMLSSAEKAQLPSQPIRFLADHGVVAITDAANQLQGYVTMHYPETTPPRGIAAAELVIALCVLALVSVPLARTISSPLEHLAKVTRAFGAGDLSVRSGLERQDEIGALARAFDEMAERIAGLRRSEKELLANVSHELRTPLARIRLALELLTEGDTQNANTYIEDIAEDLGELEQLLEDVMATARLDLERGTGGDGAPPLHIEKVDSRTVLEAAAGRFRKRHRERQLVCELPSFLPPLEADPALLRRVLDNLLDNAEKFSDREKCVELAAAAEEGDRLVIDVVDHGMGISEEDRARIFEPFFRSDRSRARTTGGVGLGLAVVKRIVDAHAGRLEVTSRVGEGCRFRVTLPLSART